MNILDEAIEIWEQQKERLKEIGAPKSVPYGDWTYHKHEVIAIAFKLYKLKQLEKDETTFLFSKKKSAWR